MNDIVLKKAAIKRELLIFTIAFVMALVVNIYAIVIYKTPWSEVLTSLGFVIIIAILLYALIFVFRLILKGIKGVIKIVK